MSGYVAGSWLDREEGDSVIKILIETGDNSREEIDIGTNIDTGAEIEVGKVIDILIELGSSGVGCRVVDICLKISICD
jgi:hypothetical protein